MLTISVYLGKHNDTGKKAAIKIIRPEVMETAEMEEIEREVEILEQVSHPNITKLISSGYMDLTSRGITNQVYCIVLEIARGGELFDFISMTGAFEENFARYFFKQLIEALEHLHSKGISHRDMKAENILLDKHYNLKVADFGYSSQKASNVTAAGTEAYMAPEVLHSRPYHGPVVDIFGAGLILFTMRAQAKPFNKAKASDSHYKNIVANRADKFWRLHLDCQEEDDHFSPEFIHLVTNLLAVNPVHRMSLSEILNHPWMQGDIPTQEEVEQEFNQRKEEVDEELSKERESDPTYSTFDMSLLEGRTVHRGIGDDDEETSEILERVAEEYDEDFVSYHKFFSTSPLEDLWNVL